MSDLLLMLVEHLTAEDIVEGDGVDIFRDFSPEEPDNVVVLQEYSGEPVPLHASFVHRSIQISARASNTSAAKLKCYEIFDELNEPGRHKVLSNGMNCLIYPRQTPFKIKVDDRGRTIYAFNIGITIQGGMR